MNLPASLLAAEQKSAQSQEAMILPATSAAEKATSYGPSLAGVAGAHGSQSLQWLEGFTISHH